MESDSDKNVMDGIADITNCTDGIADVSNVSEGVAIEIDNVTGGGAGLEVVTPVSCHFGPLLEFSKMDSLCTGAIISLSAVKKKEKENILNRSAQFELEDTAGFSVCEGHRKLLGGVEFTKKFVNHAKCLWRDHYSDVPQSSKGGPKRRRNQRNLRFRDFAITARESKKLKLVTGYLIPCDGLICKSCSYKINQILRENNTQESPQPNHELQNVEEEIEKESENPNIEIISSDNSMTEDEEDNIEFSDSENPIILGISQIPGGYGGVRGTSPNGVSA